MKKSICSTIAAWRFAAVLLAFLWVAPWLRAQPTEADVDNRYLFVFVTSSDMKARVPLMQTAVRSVLLSELSITSGGKLKADDTIGVWTLGQELRTGEFPLQTWVSERAGDIITNISAFVQKQPYKKDAALDKFWPVLQKVVKNSERLTVILVCDGKSDFQGTPFDAGVNQMFKDNRVEARKNKTPFVVIIRSQLGQYVGCTVNFPPKPFQIPPFPALPEPPPKPKPKPAEPVAAPAPVPVVMAPPMVIVGTNVATNVTANADLPPKPAPAVEPTNAAPVAAASVATSVAPLIVTNVPPAPPAPVATNPVPANPPIANFPPTNPPVAASAEPPGKGLSSGMALAIGGGLLLVAALVGLLAWARRRRGDSASFITRSMHRRD